ncbi:hypothetical protein HK102_011259 [Quaeritorhiza haematococci]|nr:hypothetical protein HK102_011259 [Quaeritorhiza haematococci]
MCKIFENQGIHYIPQDDENCSSVCAKLLGELAKLRNEYPSSTPTSSQSAPAYLSRPYNLTALEDQQLRQWFKPLDEEMLKEQEDAAQRREREERLLWLQGQAGMGKTVMAGYVAEELLKRNLLGSAYFFKYNVTNRADPSSLIRTLAYNLTQWSTRIGLQMLRMHEESPEVVESALPKMFAKLILEPLNSIKDSQPKLVVLVVDALDECGVIGARQEILDILASECNKLPNFVKIVLTSRPEKDIVASFQAIKTTPALVQVVTKFREASGGVFAWVKYAEETLEQRLAAESGERTTEDMIQDLVKDALRLPADMSELYNKSFHEDIQLGPDVIKIVRFFHKSVYDYLSDTTKCTIPGLLLDAQTMNSELAIRVNTSIPLGGGLRYACLRWTGHVQTSLHDIEAGSSSQDSEPRNPSAAVPELYKAIETFLLKHIHHWFEASSSLISKLEQILDLVDKNNQPRHDMKILLGKENEWSPCLMTLFGHEGYFNRLLSPQMGDMW